MTPDVNVCPILIGRERELDTLIAALRQGGVVLVGGEAGIGKSRLVREFAARAEAADHVVAWGRPEGVARPGPYSLVIDLLDDLSADLHQDGGEALELADWLSAPSEDRPEPPARQIAARVRGLLGRLGPRPVLVAEDLHAADEPSQAVIAHLARSARDDGVLLVGVYRHDEVRGPGAVRLLDLLARDRLANMIDLRPLSAEDPARMLEAMWGSEPTQEELETIQRLGEGVPFFIEELAGARGAIEASIPDSIARAVQARLGGLEPDARETIRTASLMGGALEPGVLALVAGRADREIADHLVAGLRAGLLADAEGRLVFRHTLLQEAVAVQIVSVERTRMHAALADSIEKLHGDRIQHHARALVAHHRGAGDTAGAARFAVMAGQRALSLGAADDARDSFAEAIDLGDDEIVLRARRGLAQVEMRTGEPERAATILEPIAGAYERLGDRAEAARTLGELGTALEMVRDEGCADVVDRAIGWLDDEDAYLRTALTVQKGLALAQVFLRVEDAEPVLREGLAAAEELGALGLICRAELGLCTVGETAGEVARADEHSARACELALRHGADELVGMAYVTRANWLSRRGRGAEALETLDVAREHVTRGLGSHLAVRLDEVRAWTLWLMGMPVEADRYAARVEVATPARAFGRVIRAWAAVEAGDMARARAIVDAWWQEVGGEAVRTAIYDDPDEAPDSKVGPQYAMMAEALVLAFDDGPVAAEALHVVERYDAFCRQAAPDISGQAAAFHARVLARAGELDRSAALLEEMMGVVPVGQYPVASAGLIEVRGLVADAQGDRAGALAGFEQAATILERIGNQSDRARCLRLAASALAALGEREGAVAALRGARELALGCGATAEVNRADGALRALGVRPRAGRPKGSSKRGEGGLTAREEEVVILVAAGATNAEIAGRLFLSPRTVEDHLSRAQRRLAVHGRAGLAAWAAKQGLV